MFGVAGFHEAE